MKKALPAKGFTLIELLVAISILAILAVIGVSIFAGAQRNARDGKRKADIDQIARAIETEKDPAGAAATYAYSSSDFSSDFPGGVKDPSSYLYCLVNNSGTADPAATWTTTCPVGYSTLLDAAGAFTTAVSGSSGWKICAPQEGGVTYCKTSLR